MTEASDQLFCRKHDAPVTMQRSLPEPEDVSVFPGGGAGTEVFDCPECRASVLLHLQLGE